MSAETGIPPARTLREIFILLVPSLLIPAFFLLVRKSQSEPNPYIYEKLGSKGGSNLSDEDDPKYSISSKSGKDPEWKLKAILCHPIKSCRGFELDTAKIDRAGIVWDRQFAIAEWSELKSKDQRQYGWKFRTLRQPGYNNLALVKPEIWLKKGSDTDGLLVVRYPLIPTGALAPLCRFLMSLKLMSSETFFQAPLTPPKDHDYPRERLEIFSDTPTWLNYQRHVPKSLATLVKAKNAITLFRVDPVSYREVHGNAPKASEMGYQPVAAASDAFPLSVQNLASVRDVADKIKKDIPYFSVRRMRPNLVFTGGPAFDEDDWKRLKVGEHQIICSCHTTRCKLPCVDPDTAERHNSQPEQVCCLIPDSDIY